MATIRDIMDAFEVLILATPAPKPTGLPYRKASGLRGLRRESHSGPDTTREFAVEAGEIQGLGKFVGPCYEIVHTLVVAIRYAHDENLDDYAELQRMAASDAGRLVEALFRPSNADLQAAGMIEIHLRGHSLLTKVEEVEGVYLQALAIDVTYDDSDPWR